MAIIYNRIERIDIDSNEKQREQGFMKTFKFRLTENGWQLYLYDCGSNQLNKNELAFASKGIDYLNKTFPKGEVKLQ